jgi:Tat protein secretion system quality control protein TatD with DNase activity
LTATAEALAGLRGVEPEQLGQATSRNFRELFALS